MTEPRQSEKNPGVQSETNAQNSELDPQAHPSGARIEQMKNEVERSKGEIANDGKAKYISSDRLTGDLAEGAREDVPSSPHRQTPESR